MSCGVYGQNKFAALEGPYLGQSPPSLVPKIFAPGIVSTEHVEVMGVFSPDLNEFYFIRKGGKYQRPTLILFQKISNRWSESVVLTSSAEPAISPNGEVMHLGNQYLERLESGWSEIKYLGPPFSDIDIMRLTASAAGTYVFDERDEIGTIRYSRFRNGKREEPKAYGVEINTGKWTAHPFIASDESYLIWDSERAGGYGGTDLYISFRQEDGSWGPAINMGKDINTEHNETYGSVTPDDKYLFFHTFFGKGKSDIYWVDAQVIDDLRD